MGWPLIPLRKVAKQVQRPVTTHPGTTYRRVGVRLWGRGAYLRDAIDGSATKYPVLYRVQKDDIVVNKIWARNGSVAVVTDDLDCSFGSSEFPTYEVDKTALLPDWFSWFTKTPGLWRQCDRLSRGTSGKNRLRPERFLDVHLPIPPLDEQRRIVAKLRRATALIDECRRTYEEIENDTKAVLSNAFHKILESAQYRPMSEIAPLVRRPVVVEPDRSHPELGIQSFGRGIFRKPPLIWEELTWKKYFLILSGDIIFSNIKAWEGAFAVAGSEDHNHVGSHRYLTCVPVEGIATANFIWFYLQSPEGLAKISAASPGSADRNRTLNQKKLEALTVPVPSIEKQLWFDQLLWQTRETRALATSVITDMDVMFSVSLYNALSDGGNLSSIPSEIN